MRARELGWALALACAVLAAPAAVAQSALPPAEGELSVQNHKMCLNVLDQVWKACKATDSETKALCSSECETAIRTALAHAECSNVVVTSSMTYDQSVQSHVNFHAYHCLPDEPADASPHAPGARRNALHARPLDPKVANECFVHEDRSDYRGFVNTTLSGYTCQKWSEQVPHHHPHAPSESNAWQGLGEHNYCRALSWDSCAWCYTTEHTPKWECCLIGSPQPSCPRKAFMPATGQLSGKDKLVLDDLISGNCPRMIIMMQLSPYPHPPGKSGWYEVVSESSAELDGRESYQLSGHHLALPGTVRQTVLGRVNANDGVFRCASDGLFFEPQGGASRIHVYAAHIPQLNASITQLIEFKPEDEGEDEPQQPENPLPLWRKISIKTYVYGGLGIYVGSMALCALLAYLVAKGGRSMSLVSPRSPGRGKSFRQHQQQQTSAAAAAAATWREDGYGSSCAPPPLCAVNGATSFSSTHGGAHAHPPHLVTDQGALMHPVHHLAATTIQQRARDRQVAPTPHAYAHGGGYGAHGGGYGAHGGGYDAHGGGAHGEAHAGFGRHEDALAAKRGGGHGARELSGTRSGAGAGAGAGTMGGGCKTFMVPFFRSLGFAVARNPWRTIALSCGFAVVLTAGLVRMRFEADSSILFLPQKTAMAGMRARYASTFGSLPDVIMMVVKRRAGGSMINRASLTSAIQLYKQIITLDALPNTPCADDARGHAPCAGHADPIELNEFCVNWYVALLGENVCSVSSLLELWRYEFGALNDDPDPQHTLYLAHKRRTVELGAASVDEQQQRVSTDAFMLQFYLNTSAPAYSNGRYALWHAKLRDSLTLMAQREALEVSWWSTRLNEDEAGSFVTKDAPLLAFSFIFVIFYVTVSLSRVSCSDAHGQAHERGGGLGGGSNVRIMLSLSCALCSALSMSSGFGLTALFGVPISPVTPLVSFMLLGVSVDNMIIIVDTFDRIDESEDVAVRLSMSLAESGTAITVTTVTTFIAFMTGLPVDLPVYSFFCTTAACCTGCLYVLQLTLFCALLVIDTQGRVQAARAYEEALFESDSAYAYEAAYGTGASGYADGQFAHGGAGGGGALLLHPSHVGSEQWAHLDGAPHGDTYNQPALVWEKQQQQQQQQQQKAAGFSPYDHAHQAGDYDDGGYDEPADVRPLREPLPAGYGDLYDYGEPAQPLGAADSALRGEQRRSSGGPRHIFPPRARGAQPAFNRGGEEGGGEAGEFYVPPPPNAHSRALSARAESDGPSVHQQQQQQQRHRARPHAPLDEQFAAEPPPSPPPGEYVRGFEHAQLSRPPPHDGGRSSFDASLAEERHAARMRHAEGDGSCMRAYARWLLLPGVRALVVLLYLAPVVFAAFTVQNLKPGLPYRQTVPVNSIIMDFLDDVDQFYAGSFPVKLVVVFEDTTPADFGLVREVLDEMLALPYTTRVHPDWMIDYGRWVQSFGIPRGEQGLHSMCNLHRFLQDAEFDDVDVSNVTLVRPLYAPPDGHPSHAARRALLERENKPAPAELRDGGASWDETLRREAPALREQLDAHQRAAERRRRLDQARAEPRAQDDDGDERPGAYDGGGNAAARADPARLSDEPPPIEFARERAWLSDESPHTPPLIAAEKRLRHAHPPDGSPAAELAASEALERKHRHAAETLVAGGGGPALHRRAHSGVGATHASGGAGNANAPVCVNNEERFKSISGGHVCDSAVSHCVTGTGHAIVAKMCPVTCGLCNDASRIARAATNNTVAQELVVGGKNYENDVLLRELTPGGCAAPPADATGPTGAPRCAGEHACMIGAQRFVVAVDLEQTMELSYYVWNEMSSKFDIVSERHGRRIRGYAYHIRFEFGFFDHTIISMALRNLLVVVLVIAVCTLVFLPTFISILAVFTVVCIDLQLLSVMAIVGLNFNSISCISLLIALGLAIDYSVHLGHAYYNAPFDTREAKVEHALVTMGSSILNAGGSTLLGTLFLARSDSVVFRTFFIFMWGTIFLGLFSGLAFAPIVLATIGPLGKRAATPKPEQGERREHAGSEWEGGLVEHG